MNHKILIVEDDVDDQIFFVETINTIDPSYKCVSVGNGAEALLHLNNTITLPSIILLDLNMPLMNGFEFLETVKKNEDFQSIPIAVFSTSASAKDKAYTQKYGAQYFFTKPQNVTELKKMLTEVLFQTTE